MIFQIFKVLFKLVFHYEGDLGREQRKKIGQVTEEGGRDRRTEKGADGTLKSDRKEEKEKGRGGKGCAEVREKR